MKQRVTAERVHGDVEYERIIWWSAEDDTSEVDVPELPGCMAHGATRPAAIKFWIKTAKDDGTEIPQPDYASWSQATKLLGDRPNESGSDTRQRI